MFFKEFLSQYGFSLIYALIMAIAGYVGIVIKNLIGKYVTSAEKRKVVDDCVLAVEQIYKDIHGEEKYERCVESLTIILNEKGITASDLEIRMMIEAAVKRLNLSSAYEVIPVPVEEIETESTT